MAADDSFSQTIFFIASILVAVSLSAVIIGVSGSMAQEIKLKADGAASEMGTSVTFINDPRSVPYNDGKLTLYLMNTGEVSQYYNDIIIFIDGQYANYTVTSINGSNGSLAPGAMVQLDVEIELEQGDHSVKVLVANGVSDTMDFRL